MENLAGLIHSILAALPDNQLISDEELCERLFQCERLDVETEDITEALREIDEEEGLVSAFMETDDMLTWGVALKSKVKRFPDRALIAIGFEPQPKEV